MSCVVKAPALSIEIEPCGPERMPEWKEFLVKSNNGTLFHDLDFLSYHPPQKFDTLHLMFFRAGKLMALLPAAIVEESPGRFILQSPYGASVGGLVLPPGLGVETALGLVAALKQFAGGRKLHGIEMRIGPNIYSREPDDLPSFSLMAGGFKLVRRWLSFVVPIGAAGSNPADGLFSDRMLRYVRANRRKGLCAREAGPDRLDDFYRILMENWNRHPANPTHEKDELERMFQLAPGRARLFLCAGGGTEIAGALIFILNGRVAYTMYLCQSNENKDRHGPAVLMAHVMDCLAGEGFKYLDMGPSASDRHLNAGAAFFKESIGAHGFCRDTWRWEASA